MRKDTPRKIRQAKRHARSGKLTLKEIAKRVGLSESTLRRYDVKVKRRDSIAADAAQLSATDGPAGVAAPAAAEPGPYPGVSACPDGGLLRHDPADFAAVLADARDKYGVQPEWIVRDYHIGRTLWSLFAAHPPGTAINAPRTAATGHSSDVGSLAFAGGTALALTHNLIERISEDIDFVIVCKTNIDKKPAKKIRRPVLADIAAACSPNVDFGAHKPTSGGNVGGRLMTVGSTPEYLKAEVSFFLPLQDETLARLNGSTGGTFELVKVQACQSLMGRAATQDMRDRYPELRAFEVPALSVAVTACNKFFALHGRACEPDPDGGHSQLRKRGRDLYDLWAIASSEPHAREARATVAYLAAHIASGPIAEPHPRPKAGFGHSPAFERGTAAYKTLRDGFHDALVYVWGQRPQTFDEAVEAARSLDQAHNL